jgi:hypothetical protein
VKRFAVAVFVLGGAMWLLARRKSAVLGAVSTASDASAELVDALGGLDEPHDERTVAGETGSGPSSLPIGLVDPAGALVKGGGTVGGGGCGCGGGCG